jgi:hypothetical protein
MGRPLQRLVIPMLFFNDVGPCAFDKGKDLAPFSFGNLKFLQGRMHMAEEDLPIPSTNSHPLVGRHHIPAGIIQGASGARAEKIDQQLFLPTDAIRCPMCPKAAKLMVRHQARKQIISHSCNGIVPAEASIQGRWCLIGHESLLGL